MGLKSNNNQAFKSNWQSLDNLHQTPEPAASDIVHSHTLIYYDGPLISLQERRSDPEQQSTFELVSLVDRLLPKETQCEFAFELSLICTVSPALAQLILESPEILTMADIYLAPDAQFWLGCEQYIPYTKDSPYHSSRLRLGDFSNVDSDYLPKRLSVPLVL